MKGRDFPASKSLLGLGPFSSSSSQRRSARGLRAFSSAMRLSMAASDSGRKGRKLSGPGGTSSCAILSSCSFRGQREAQLGQRAAAEKEDGDDEVSEPVNNSYISRSTHLMYLNQISVKTNGWPLLLRMFLSSLKLYYCTLWKRVHSAH